MTLAVGYDPVSGTIIIGGNGVFPARSLTAAVSTSLPGYIQINDGAGRGEQHVAWDDVVSLDGSYVPGSMADALNYLRGEFAKQRTISRTFDQSEPATLWVIAHGLGFYPSVRLIDSAGDPITGDVRSPDINTLTVSFANPVSGTAYLS